MPLLIKEKIALKIVPHEIPWYPRVPMDHGYDGLERPITFWVV